MVQMMKGFEVLIFNEDTFVPPTVKVGDGTTHHPPRLDDL